MNIQWSWLVGTVLSLCLVGALGCEANTGSGNTAGQGGGDAGNGGSGGMGGSGGTPMVCVPGATEPCYTGPTNSLNVGVCKSGQSSCNADGNGFGPCEGEVLPAKETCNTPDDDDCDGMVNEEGTACVCQPGQTMACYSGPIDTRGKGICSDGVWTCSALGTEYGPCVGEQGPQLETCDALMLDEDCDGQVDEEGTGCICGDGIVSVDLGEQCDDQNTDAYDGCLADCHLGCGPTYAGSVSFQGPDWSFNGLTGLAAGDKMCQGLGGAKVCDYEQVKQAVAAGELNNDPNVKAGQTAWIHRTTPETVGGVVYPPGNGARCDDWTADTNNVTDGEYVTFTKVGGMVSAQYSLDSDPLVGTTHVQLDLPCGGAFRLMLCCHPQCP